MEQVQSVTYTHAKLLSNLYRRNKNSSAEAHNLLSCRAAQFLNDTIPLTRFKGMFEIPSVFRLL